MPGNDLLLNVSTLKSVISIGSGRVAPASSLHSIEHEREVAIDRAARAARGMHDEHAHHAERDLRHLVEVRVVHERARAD